MFKKPTVMYVNYSAPVTDQKNLRCGRPPHAKRGELVGPALSDMKPLCAYITIVYIYIYRER